MTDEDVRQITESAKNILRTKEDVFSQHILAYISFLEKENAELKKHLEVTNKENERIRRTMLTYSECITEHQNTIKRKDEENAELKAQIEKIKLESDKQLKIVHKQLESLLIATTGLIKKMLVL